MDDLYLLSESDLGVLRQLLEEHRNQSLTTINRPAIELETTEAPEVYVVLAPFGGIPARVGLIPGVASNCTVYNGTYVGSTLHIQAAGFGHPLVYNLSLTAVAAGSYPLAVRDKWGTWFVGGDGSSSSSGVVIVDGDGILIEGSANCTNNLSKLRPMECLTATVAYLSQTVTLKPAHPPNGRWSSDGNVTYPGGTGIMTFWYANGAAHLSLGGSSYTSMELLNCGDGCFSGGPLTGHAWPEDLESQEETGTGHLDSTGTGTGDERIPCTGYTFEVCLSCVECPTVDTPCTEVVCPGKLIPRRLYLTVQSAHCPAFNFFTQLDYNAVDGWRSPLLVLSSPFPFQSVYAVLSCFVNDHFLLSIYYNNWSGNGLHDILLTQSLYPTGGSFFCDPFYLVSGMSSFGTTLDGILCTGAADVTFNITE